MTLWVSVTTPAREQAAEARDVLSAGDRQALGRDGAGVVSITGGEGGLEDVLDRGHGRLAWHVEQQRATAAQQMRQAGPMGGGGQIAIGMPAVALHGARIVVADERRRLRQPAARHDRVNGRLRRHPHPQPLQDGGDAPTRFIDREDGAAADGRAQGLVGRLRLTRRAMNRVDQAAPRDGRPEAVTPQRRDLAVRQAESLIEQHREGDRLWPQLRGRRAERIGRLQAITALHPTPVLRALPDVDVETAHARSMHRELFLVLGRDAVSALGFGIWDLGFGVWGFSTWLSI